MSHLYRDTVLCLYISDSLHLFTLILTDSLEKCETKSFENEYCTFCNDFHRYNIVTTRSVGILTSGIRRGSYARAPFRSSPGKRLMSFSSIMLIAVTNKSHDIAPRILIFKKKGSTPRLSREICKKLSRTPSTNFCVRL